MSENYIRNVVEAALLAAGRPLQLPELALLFDEPSRPEPVALRAALDSLEAEYSSRGIEVKETATGFRIQVRRDVANEVSRLWPERPPRYSRALLETLALIAYRQPITRGEIEAVRGVAVNPNIIKTVLERNWVRVVGTRDVPGRPELLGTTKEFLDYFGLRALDDLPPLAELKALGDVNLQLDLAKSTDPTDEGSGGASGAGGGEGANGAGEGGAGSAVAALGALAVVAALDGDAVAGVGDPADAVTEGDAAVTANVSDVALESLDAVAETSDATIDPENAEAIASAAPEGASEAGNDNDAATGDNVESNAATPDESLAFEHEPATSALAHVEVESDSGDVTVEVEALRLIEGRIDASIESDDPAPEDAPLLESQADTSIETGEFEMAELGITKPAPVIEAEFDADDLDSAIADDDAADDDATDDDEEELSAGPQSSTELVAAPRDRDD